MVQTFAGGFLHINRNTINAYYNEIRAKILQYSLKGQEKELGEFKLDESYFGARRVRGKRGRGAAGKMSVLGLLKRDGKVFVTVVPNCSKEELMPIIQGKILTGSTIHTDGWKAYDGLILNGYNPFIMKTNLHAGNRMSTALSASGVTPNVAFRNSTV